MNLDLLPILAKGLQETLYMVLLSSTLATMLGWPIGVTLTITSPGHIREQARINRVLSEVVNILRSFPFIIMIILLLPLSRLIVGTTLGATAAIVPLSICAAPFIGRIVENCLQEVERGKIEAAQAMGAHAWQIIIKVLVPEALPALVRGITLAVITITGFTATAGAIGAGGLGSLAIRYGYMRYQNDVMAATIAILVLLVAGIQWGGDRIARHINVKRYKLENN